MAEITDLEQIREARRDDEPHFNVWAMCLPCKHKWIGTVHYMTSLFTLECPKCNATDSFASIIPDSYLECHGADDESIKAKYDKR